MAEYELWSTERFHTFLRDSGVNVTSVVVDDWDADPVVVNLEFEPGVPQQQIDWAYAQWLTYDQRRYQKRPYRAVQQDILNLNQADYRELISMMGAEWLVDHPVQAKRIGIPVIPSEPAS